jgi:hypothetical protein
MGNHNSCDRRSLQQSAIPARGSCSGSQGQLRTDPARHGQIGLLANLEIDGNIGVMHPAWALFVQFHIEQAVQLSAYGAKSLNRAQSCSRL